MIEESKKSLERKNALKILLLIAGTFFVVMGLIGIFIPILPTTPFLLLAGACYIRSSQRAYEWLLSNRLFGKYLKSYIEKRGIPMGLKVGTIVILWITIMISAFLLNDIWWLRILLVIIAISVTIHILLIKTLKK